MVRWERGIRLVRRHAALKMFFACAALTATSLLLAAQTPLETGPVSVPEAGVIDTAQAHLYFDGNATTWTTEGQTGPCTPGAVDLQRHHFRYGYSANGCQTIVETSIELLPPTSCAKVSFNVEGTTAGALEDSYVTRTDPILTFGWVSPDGTWWRSTMSAGSGNRSVVTGACAEDWNVGHTSRSDYSVRDGFRGELDGWSRGTTEHLTFRWMFTPPMSSSPLMTPEIVVWYPAMKLVGDHPVHGKRSTDLGEYDDGRNWRQELDIDLRSELGNTDSQNWTGFSLLIPEPDGGLASTYRVSSGTYSLDRFGVRIHLGSEDWRETQVDRPIDPSISFRYQYGSSTDTLGDGIFWTLGVSAAGLLGATLSTGRRSIGRLAAAYAGIFISSRITQVFLKDAPLQLWAPTPMAIALRSVTAVEYVLLGIVLMLSIRYKIQQSAQHQRAAEAKARETTRRARETEELLQGVTHDLKTPLLAMNWLTEDLGKEIRDADPEAVEASLARIRSSVDGMSTLVHDLLAMAEADQAAPRHESVSIQGLADAAAAGLHERAQRVGAAIRTQGDAEATTICDPARMRMVLQNLVSNALKYGATEGGTVTIGWDHPGQAQRLWVEDHGPGVPDRDKERIFDMFVRGEGAARTDGTGLGLAHVRRLVEKMGGTVTIEDVEPHGARFVVELPDRVQGRSARESQH